MTQYFRITGYSPEHDVCFIMDSNGKFDKLWQFSAYVIQHGCKVLEVGSDEKFMDINIDKAEPNPTQLIIRATAKGKPNYISKTIDGIPYQAVSIDDKAYIPER